MTKGKLFERIEETTHCETGFEKVYTSTMIDLINEAKRDYLKRVYRLTDDKLADKKFMKDFLQGLRSTTKTHRELKAEGLLGSEEWLWIIDWFGDFT
jgi:hypothetical protein